MRVGVIGTGFGARVVAPVFAATPGCTVVDVVSARDADAVDGLCARTDVDLVGVHSPPFLHRAHVERALGHGHAVLCDKPFGRDAVDAAAMTRAAADAGAVALVNLEFRHDPARRHLAGMIAAGRLGRIEHVAWTHLSSSSRVPLRPAGWRFDRVAGGGWLGAWGSHAVDALRWWLGDLRVTSATLATRITERPDPAVDGTRRVDAEDAFTATFAGPGGVTATVDATSAAPATLAPRIVVTGSTAVAEVVADQRITVRGIDGARGEWAAPAVDGDPHLAPMRAWAEVVRDAVLAGVAPEDATTFGDGLAMARVLDAVRAAAG